MKTTTYYYLLIGMAGVLLLYYTILFVFPSASPIPGIVNLKRALALAVVIGETGACHGTLRRVILIASPFAALGILFEVQFWPYGRLLFSVSMLVIFSLLFIGAFLSKEKILKMLLLFYPVIFAMHFGVISWPGEFLYDLLDIVVLLITVIILLVKIKRSIHTPVRLSD